MLGFRGFSLIETVITLALVSIIVIGMMTLWAQHFNKLGTITAKYERTSLLEDIREILGDSASCLRIIGGKDPNNTVAGQITEIWKVRGKADVDADGNDIDADDDDIIDEFKEYMDDNSADLAEAKSVLEDRLIFEANSDEKLAKKYGNNQVQFLGFSLKSDHPIGANAKGIAKFFAHVVTPKGTYARDNTKFIRLNVVTDADKKIIQCGLGGVKYIEDVPPIEKACTMLGGTLYKDSFAAATKRGGLGDCANLNLEGDLTATHSINIFSDPLDGSLESSLDPPVIPDVLTGGSDFTSTQTLTKKVFCENVLGGRLTAEEKCPLMRINGYVKVKGGISTSKIRFFEEAFNDYPNDVSGYIVGFDGGELYSLSEYTSLADFSSATVGNAEIEPKEICGMLGGSYNPASERCENLNIKILIIHKKPDQIEGGLSSSGNKGIQF